MKLPKGLAPLEDMLIIDHLINDEIFIKSIEEEMGRIIRLWADWESKTLVYELSSGKVKQSKLDKILSQLKKMNYMKEFEH